MNVLKELDKKKIKKYLHPEKKCVNIVEKIK